MDPIDHDHRTEGYMRAGRSLPPTDAPTPYCNVLIMPVVMPYKLTYQAASLILVIQLHSVYST